MPKPKKQYLSLEDIEKILEAKESTVNLEKVAAAWLKAIGGIDGLVDLLQNEYRVSKAGSIVRAKLHELQFRLIEKVFPATKIENVSMLTDKDLEKVMMDYCKRIVIHDATQENKGLEIPEPSGDTGAGNTPF